ncbi:hypothetical protein HFP51_02205 [Parasphingopyxis sp. CP4]|uniref:DUF6356 family protein n=1 Tax=Parasphingopyxis sp. CP4 TaxID=2724527 RepID=UPI0015A2339E|nr:DUF6356 family protein [Parasphingopyxis sp. CP4]QLC21101.1 hypothetical protein HFP51_02205 [Parasphingopyxis sp. CP4]
MATLLTQHLRDVGETYTEHLGMASGFGLRLVVTGCACLVHGIFPFLFERTGSNMVRRLHAEMVRKRADTLHQDWVI